MLFDPDNLGSRLCLRPQALRHLIDLLNSEQLQEAWQSAMKRSQAMKKPSAGYTRPSMLKSWSRHSERCAFPRRSSRPATSLQLRTYLRPLDRSLSRRKHIGCICRVRVIKDIAFGERGGADEHRVVFHIVCWLQTLFDPANSILDDTTHMSRSGPDVAVVGWYVEGSRR